MAQRHTHTRFSSSDVLYISLYAYACMYGGRIFGMRIRTTFLLVNLFHV